MPARAEHGIDVPASAIRPQEMLEHLIGDDQIELARQSVRANVELRVLDAMIAGEPQVGPFAAGDLQCVKLRWPKCIHELASAGLHDNAAPFLRAWRSKDQA